MLVSWNWLKEYIKLDCGIEEFCDRMIMSGSNIETCKEIGAGLDKVVIGKIEKIEKHPDADKLAVCMINTGSKELLQIVTGATNIFEGAYVPVALDGSTLPGPLHGQPKQEGGVKITAGKLRGVDSFGMLCGCSELGFDEKVSPFASKDGIWILEGDWSEYLGKAIDEAMEFKDYTVDFEITPNRPDCLSMLGMAREAAATFGGKMEYPENGLENTEEKVENYVDVEIKSDKCIRYTARVIKDVKVKQSPWWMQKRLMSAGMRPINNIVDITNCVMMEYGQPLHAFDIRNVKDGKIIVDMAEDGEKFTTLDGKERELTSDMLMIKDAERSIAVAGVMGGLNSEVLDDTEMVILESANFEGSSVRQTSKKLGFRTEASSRYEKGIDPNLCKEASDRFCHLVEELGAGVVVEGIVDIYPELKEAVPVDARVSRINKVLGTDISRDKMTEIMESLECTVSGDGDVMTITPPTVRQDLNREVDFVEEVARIYGYDNLPMTLPVGRQVSAETDNRKLRKLAGSTLCALGADEIQTFSFVSPKQMDMINLDEDSSKRDFVKIINPLGEDTSVMRTLLLPSMMEVLARNWARKVKAVRAWEIGTVFTKNGEDSLPIENYNISVGVYGEKEDFFTLKGMIVSLLREMGIDRPEFVKESAISSFHPGRCARIYGTDEDGNKVEIGIMGEIHPDVCENYDIDDRAYAAELLFEKIEAISDKAVNYRRPPKYPAMERDIALVVDEETSVGELQSIIEEAGSEILREVRLFDIYRGEQVGENMKSVAFNLLYRHDDRTLTDKETDEANSRVVEALSKKAGAAIRDN